MFSYLPNVRTSPIQSMSVPSSRVGSLVESEAGDDVHHMAGGDTA